MSDLKKSVFDDRGEQLFGLDAELYLKRKEKRDTKRRRVILEWVEEETGCDEIQDIFQDLKSGVILCTLLNRLQPGTVSTIHTEKDAKLPQQLPMLYRENLKRYLDGCRALGMREEELFVMGDLWNEKDEDAIEQHLYALNRVAQLMDTYEGRAVGVRVYAKLNRSDTWSARNKDFQEARERYIASLEPVNKQEEAVFDHKGHRLHGMDAELYQKRQEKRNTATLDRESKLLLWVSKKVNQPIEDIQDLQSGIILCTLMNTLAPGAIPKIHTRPIKLLQRENIGFYLKACQRFGMDKSLFQISDLVDLNYPEAVFINLEEIQRAFKRHPNGIHHHPSLRNKTEGTPLVGSKERSHAQDEDLTEKSSCSCIIL